MIDSLDTKAISSYGVFILTGGQAGKGNRVKIQILVPTPCFEFYNPEGTASSVFDSLGHMARIIAAHTVNYIRNYSFVP